MIKERASTLLLMVGGIIVNFIAPSPTLAHEVYVLDHQQWQAGLTAAPINLLASLEDPDQLKLIAFIAVIALTVLMVSIYFWISKNGRQIDKRFQGHHETGRLLIRLSLGAALLIGAQAGTILGPELSILTLPSGQFIHYALYGLAILTLLGWFSELTAAALIIIYCLIVWTYGTYTFTYINYLGEMIALLIFGAGAYSVDRWSRADQPADSQLGRDLEALIVRVSFGLALLYAAITVKVLHPAVLIEVINRYHLTRYHWLFPGDAIFVTLGAAVVEIVICLCIIFGLQTRLVVAIFLFYLTLSLIFFQESVWPHLMLYGLSFYLIANNGGRLTIDQWLLNRYNPLKAKK